MHDVLAGELMRRMRRIFSVVDPETEDPFRAIKRYDWVVFWDRTKDVLKDGAKEIAHKSPDLLIDLVKGLA